MSRQLQEEELLRQLKEREESLHHELVETTHRLKNARQEVAACEASLQFTMAQLNHVRCQMLLLWQAAP